jgi:serine/threonine protein kinase
MLDEARIDQERNRRLEELFEAAIDLTSAERTAFIERECAEDPVLRREVEALLAAAPSLSSSNPVTILRLKRHARDTVVAPPIEMATAPTHHDGVAFKPGTRIYHYELMRELGSGGMGSVYLARDTKLGRRVAIKFLHHPDRSLSERFLLEAQATARCNHENIVVIHDVKDYGGMPFMVLEYLKGQTLDQFIGKDALPPIRAVQLMVPVVRALVCAHQHKIVHRDLKPENIFLTDTGAIKVLDFGVAKLLCTMYGAEAQTSVATFAARSLQLQPELTRHGMLVGTLPYMSPEQWGGDEVDERTDIWAVGILLYCMVTGAHPLAPLSGPMLAVTRLLDQPMPSAHDAGVDVPPALADIIDKCLKKHKEERIPNATALLEALEALLPHQTIRAPDTHDSPYAGLAPFQESDAHRFFGRSHDIAAVVEWLRTQPLVGIVGPSGVGKSSFVRAGVIPALKHLGEDWEAFVIRPGRQPMTALAGIVMSLTSDDATTICAMLASSNSVIARLRGEPGYLGTVLRARARAQSKQIVLFVDQFEELYTLTHDTGERAAFTACLAGMSDDADTPLRVILSVRVDFLHRVAEDRAFMAELGQGLYFLTPPDRAGLREALTRPAEMVGYRFESNDMIEHMLDSLVAIPGALPLLQFAAMRLWDARDQTQQLLTERSYQIIGGVDGALAGHANAVLTALSPQDQALVRAIFLQLVTPERTRAIALVNELRELSPDRDAVQRVLDHLVNARLLVVRTGDEDDQGEAGGEATVEIVHESLVHRWPMLEHWLDENQEDVAVLEQLRTTARQWHSKGRPAGLLWRGEAMRDAERWYRRYRGVLPTLQREYLNAVFALATRAARTRRWLVAGSIAVLSMLVVAGSVALVWIRNAERESRAAERKVREQLEIIQAKERDRAEAERKAEEERAHASAARARANAADTQIELSKEELRQANQELRVALTTAQQAEALARQESMRAQQEAQRAHDAAEVSRRANQELEELNAKLQELNAKLQRLLMEEKERLAEERARVQSLEKQFGALGATLK